MVACARSSCAFSTTASQSTSSASCWRSTTICPLAVASSPSSRSTSEPVDPSIPVLLRGEEHEFALAEMGDDVLELVIEVEELHEVVGGARLLPEHGHRRCLVQHLVRRALRAGPATDDPEAERAALGDRPWDRLRCPDLRVSTLGGAL